MIPEWIWFEGYPGPTMMTPIVTSRRSNLKSREKVTEKLMKSDVAQSKAPFLMIFKVSLAENPSSCNEADPELQRTISTSKKATDFVFLEVTLRLFHSRSIYHRFWSVSMIAERRQRKMERIESSRPNANKNAENRLSPVSQRSSL